MVYGEAAIFSNISVTLLFLSFNQAAYQIISSTYSALPKRNSGEYNIPLTLLHTRKGTTYLGSGRGLDPYQYPPHLKVRAGEVCACGWGHRRQGRERNPEIPPALCQAESGNWGAACLENDCIGKRVFTAVNMTRAPGM